MPFVQLHGELFERVGLAQAHRTPVFRTHDDIKCMMCETPIKCVELDQRAAVVSNSVANERRFVHRVLDVDFLFQTGFAR